MSRWRPRGLRVVDQSLSTRLGRALTELSACAAAPAAAARAWQWQHPRAKTLPPPVGGVAVRG